MSGSPIGVFTCPISVSSSGSSHTLRRAHLTEGEGKGEQAPGSYTVVFVVSV